MDPLSIRQKDPLKGENAKTNTRREREKRETVTIWGMCVCVLISLLSFGFSLYSFPVDTHVVGM